MFMLIAVLVLFIAILLIIFPEQIISFLLNEQHRLFSFFGTNSEGKKTERWQKMWDELLDDQQSNYSRFKYRKLWVRIWSFVLILFTVFSILFYWLFTLSPH